MSNLGASQIWRSMIKIRDRGETSNLVANKIWHIKLLFYNWTKLGALYFIVDSPLVRDDAKVQKFITNA